MHDPEAQNSRRTEIKGAATAGFGLAVGGAPADGYLAEAAVPPEGLVISNDLWFAERAWSVSANKVLGATTTVTSLAKRIYRPTSATEIVEIVTVAFLGLQIAPLPPLTRRGPMRGN